MFHNCKIFELFLVLQLYLSPQLPFVYLENSLHILLTISFCIQFCEPTSELSDGQRYRFKLAKAIETGADVWVADEFMAVLDRTAAKVIAYSVQKTARKVGATLIVATTHTDMVQDLGPDLYIEKRYREKLRIEAVESAAQKVAERSVTRDELNTILLKVM
jgi:ABC-type phosphate/phosphonate transport system ATPase subunit